MIPWKFITKYSINTLLRFSKSRLSLEWKFTSKFSKRLSSYVKTLNFHFENWIKNLKSFHWKFRRIAQHWFLPISRQSSRMCDLPLNTQLPGVGGAQRCSYLLNQLWMDEISHLWQHQYFGKQLYAIIGLIMGNLIELLPIGPLRMDEVFHPLT